jgi:hypothetical protein
MAKVTIRHAPHTGKAAENKASGLIYLTDSRGRKLGLRKVPFLEEFRILETVGPELSANQVYMGMLNFLLLIGEIDGVDCEIPRTKRAVEALIQWGGPEAFQAITGALADENDNEVKTFFGNDKSTETKIKNSDGIPASETVAG